MACGCVDSSCLCVVQGAEAIVVTGTGNAGTPYIASLLIDPASEAPVSQSAAGLKVDCCPLCVTDTGTVDLSLDEADCLSADVIFDPDFGIEDTGDGIGIKLDPSGSQIASVGPNGLLVECCAGVGPAVTFRQDTVGSLPAGTAVDPGTASWVSDLHLGTLLRSNGTTWDRVAPSILAGGPWSTWSAIQPNVSRDGFTPNGQIEGVALDFFGTFTDATNNNPSINGVNMATDVISGSRAYVGNITPTSFSNIDSTSMPMFYAVVDPNANSSTSRIWIGLFGGGVNPLVDDSLDAAGLSGVGFRHSSSAADGNWKLVGRSAAGIETVVDTGAAFSANDEYVLSFGVVNLNGSVSWTIERYLTGTGVILDIFAGTTGANFAPTSNSVDLGLFAGIQALTASIKNLRIAALQARTGYYAGGAPLP